MAKLTPKELRFTELYEGNGVEAMRGAGYKGSSNVLSVTASRLLRKPKIRDVIEARNAKRSQRTEITADKILTGLYQIAFSDPRLAFDENGNLKNVADLPDDIALAMSSIESEELYEGHGRDKERVGDTKKIRFWNKNNALELLGKHLVLFTDKVQLSGSVDLNDGVAKNRDNRDLPHEPT